MTIFKIVGLAVIGVTLIFAVKTLKPDMASQASIAIGIMIVIAAIEPMLSLFSSFQEIAARVGIQSTYIKSLLKIVGLAYLTQFAADICTDAGEQALSGRVEFAGKLLILAVSIPAVLSVLELVSSLVTVG